MTKKKILTLAMTLSMVAILAIGGTIAYFTDTEDEVNVFTLGNLDITLNEDKRDGEDGLTEFEDNEKLLPIVGSAQGAKETVPSKTEYKVENDWSVPTEAAAANWVDKIVSVTNNGSETAYVRVLFAFPADMDDAKSAAEMMLHWNYDGNMPAGTWSHADAAMTVTLDEKTYNVYNYTYLPTLAAGKTTEWPAITGVYIDSRVNATQTTVTNEDGTTTNYVTYSMVNGRGKTVTSAAYAEGTGPKLYVVAQAVQSEGFADAATALEAGFPLTKENAQTWFNAAE